MINFTDNRPWRGATELAEHYKEVRKRLNPPPRPKPIVVTVVAAPPPPPPPPPAPKPRPQRSLPAKARETIMIERVVANHYGFGRRELHSVRRKGNLPLARQVAWYLMRKIKGDSTPRIGTLFEKDHSTVVHGLYSVEHRMEIDPMFAAEVEALEAEVRWSLVQ